MDDETGENPCALIVMGVSGSGKSTIADGLAERLRWTFEDGDRFHPASNVAKMSAGHPLTDEDRWPWLQAIADEIDRVCKAGEHAVIACSALKRVYRDVLVHGHFMPPGLLASQFSTLEPPDGSENPITVSIDASVEAVIDDIVRQLNLSPAERGTPRRNRS